MSRWSGRHSPRSGTTENCEPPSVHIGNVLGIVIVFDLSIRSVFAFSILKQFTGDFTETTAGMSWMPTVCVGISLLVQSILVQIQTA